MRHGAREQRYGTIICDLERCKTIALLPNREPATVQVWLADQPQIAIVARDRERTLQQMCKPAQEISINSHKGNNNKMSSVRKINDIVLADDFEKAFGESVSLVQKFNFMKSCILLLLEIYPHQYKKYEETVINFNMLLSETEQTNLVVKQIHYEFNKIDENLKKIKI